MSKRIVTFTTDWGYRDHYTGAVKGKLLSLVKADINIIDITHGIGLQNVFETSYVLKNCMDFFPEGTIHIIGVSAEASPDTPHLLVTHNKRYFIGADNGIFHLLFDKPDSIIEIDIHQDTDFFTFPERDVFIKVAAMILNGEKPESIGPTISNVHSHVGFFTPADTKNTISGVVIHVDNYGNIITNISHKKFREVVRNRPFIISFNGYEIDTVHTSYKDVSQGDLVAIFNTSGLLEIAQLNSHAASILGMRFNDSVKVIVEE